MSLRILVERLTATPAPHRFEVSASWWERRTSGARADDLEVLEPFVFELAASKLGDDLYLEGAMTGAIEVACSRCAKRYRHPLREEVRLVLEPAGVRVPSDPESARTLSREGMCLGDELDVGWYRGSEVHLDTLFGEVIALSLPMQPLPPVDDAGCCVVCGADRTKPIETVEQGTGKPASPFAVLASLRRGEDGGGS